MIVSTPLATAWETGIGSGTRRDELLVVVNTDEGVTGLGSSYHAHAPESVKALIDTKLAPMVIGQSALDIQGIWEKMHYGSVYLGNAGVSALSGIDIALWDLLGKVTRQPVKTLLGADGVDAVASYVGCMSLGHKPLDALVEEAHGYVAEGYRALKLRGGAGVAQDLQVVREVRAAVGPSVRIMIDMNARYSWTEAVQVSRGLQESDVFWMEDPFDFTVANHHDDMGKLRSLALTPLASGGNVYSRFDVRNLIERGGVDYLTPDVVKCGGISEALKVAALASAYNMIVAPHTLNGLGQVANLHFAAAIPAHARGPVEWDPTSPNALRDDMLTSPIIVRDGTLQVPSGAGLGTELDWQVCEKLVFSQGEEIVGHGQRRVRSWDPSEQPRGAAPDVGAT